MYLQREEIKAKINEETRRSILTDMVEIKELLR
jgi:hypothetical protein